MRENRSLRDSAAALDEVLEQAGSIFGNLVGLPAFPSFYVENEMLCNMGDMVQLGCKHVQGQETWNQQVNQNKVLKNARRKLLDAANSIGAHFLPVLWSGVERQCGSHALWEFAQTSGVAEPCECH